MTKAHPTPKAHFISNARKDIYEHGLLLPDGKLNRSLPRDESDKIIIRKGESYYWWKLREQNKQYSKNIPNASQLTNNPYYNRIYKIIEAADGFIADNTLASNINNMIDDIVSLREELSERLDNMPKQFKNNPHGTILKERISNLNNYLTQLASINTKSTKYQEMLSKLSDCNLEL